MTQKPDSPDADEPDSVLADVRVGAVFEQLLELPGVESEAAAIDRIEALTRVANACGALLAEATEALRVLRTTRDDSEDVPASARAKSVISEIALARRESPHRAGRHTRLAFSLTHELPETYRLLKAGLISEEKALIIDTETCDLNSEDRAVVDASITDDAQTLGVRALAGRVRHMCETLNPNAAVARHERSVTERHVSIQPAPGGMAYLTALLPLKQAVATYQTLYTHATTTGNATTSTGETSEPGVARTLGQIMADTLVERITGQATANDVPVEVGVLMSLEAITGENDDAAVLPGHGTIPAHVIREDLLTNTDSTTTQARVTLRRLFTHPNTGQLVAMESKARTFPPLLRRLVIYRDGVCRTPGCDAPIRHIDHATPHHAGGETSWENASGLCAHCNYAKETPGWTHTTTNGTSTLTITTPTGHTYRKHTPPPIPKLSRPPRTGYGDGGKLDIEEACH